MAEDDKDPGLLGAIKDQLVASKEKWAPRRPAAHRPPAGAGRLPPGQRLVREWPVLDLGIKPTVREQDWKLRVDGLVAEPLTWDWNTFLEQPQAVGDLRHALRHRVVALRQQVRGRRDAAPAGRSQAARDGQIRDAAQP